ASEAHSSPRPQIRQWRMLLNSHIHNRLEIYPDGLQFLMWIWWISSMFTLPASSTRKRALTGNALRLVSSA
ncbi:TPA: hypothetical protein ACF311_004341, partial [Vibrio parahaemolyticus]